MPVNNKIDFQISKYHHYFIFDRGLKNQIIFFMKACFRMPDRQPGPQLCLAYRSAGGTVAVVLSSRSKPEMEELFKRTIPHESRFGTRFVFREVGCRKTRIANKTM